jgi:cobalamin biosynthesis Mg chelatase CobN
VLALLALACFPVLAHADSAGIEYETGVPNVGGHKSSPKPGSNIPQAKASDSGGSTVPSESETTETSESSSGGPSSGGNNPSTGNDGGSGQPSQGNGSAGQQKPTGEAGLSQTPQKLTSSPTGSGSDGGSSSPLVPILIAVAVLAAISVGAVIYRQRRQRPGSGSTISQNAS